MMSGLWREGMRTAPLIVVATLLGALAASPSRAQDAPQPESPLRSLMRGAGLATDVDPPPDFVVQSRPAQQPASIPVFATPAEPPGTIKTAKELDAMDSDLAAVGKTHDALRAAFPPSAKAVAEAAAAKKAKSEKKAAAGGATPKF
jgi:hypothetical protein